MRQQQLDAESIRANARLQLQTEQEVINKNKLEQIETFKTTYIKNNCSC